MSAQKKWNIGLLVCLMAAGVAQGQQYAAPHVVADGQTIGIPTLILSCPQKMRMVAEPVGSDGHSFVFCTAKPKRRHQLKHKHGVAQGGVR